MTEHAGLFTEPALLLVVEQLSTCVQLAQLAPQAFSGIVGRHANSQSPVMLQMLHGLARIFGDDILPAARFNRLQLAVAQSPAFSAEASAICLAWLWADNPSCLCFFFILLFFFVLFCFVLF